VRGLSNRNREDNAHRGYETKFPKVCTHCESFIKGNEKEIVVKSKRGYKTADDEELI
jgi:hypothetical protein